MLGCTDRRVAPGIRRTRAAAAGAGGADCVRQDPAVVGVPAALTAPSWGGLAAPPGPVIRLDSARPAGRWMQLELLDPPLSPPTTASDRVRPLPSASGLGVPGLKHTGRARPLPSASGAQDPRLARRTGVRLLPSASGLGVLRLKHTGRARPLPTASGAYDPRLTRRPGSARFLRPRDWVSSASSLRAGPYP